MVNFSRTQITGIPDNASILNPEFEQRLIELVGDALNNSKIKQTELTAALSEDAAVVRYFKMPLMPKSEQDTAIKFEARRYIPFKLDEIKYDYSIFKDRLEPKKVAVLFAAARNEYIERLVNSIGKAGCKVKSVDIVPLGLERIFQLSENINRLGVAAVARLEREALSIYIYNNGVPYFVQELLFSQNAPNLFESLLNQLRLSFDYYARQFPGEPITKLFITGEGVQDGWDEKLHEELKIVAKISDPLAHMDPDKTLPAGALTVLGIAMRGASVKWPALLDLAASTYKPKADVVTVKNILIAEALLIFVIMISRAAIISGDIAHRKSEAGKIRLTIPAESVSRSLQDKSKIELYKYNLKRKFSFVDMAASKRVYWTFKLSRLIDLMPPGIWYYDISLDDKMVDTDTLPAVKFERSLAIKGSAYSQAEDSAVELINNFVNSLKNDAKFSEGFTTIEVKSISKGEEEGTPVARFELVCHSD